MQVLNFGHPLTAASLGQIVDLLEGPVSAVIDIRVQVAQDQPLTPQVAALVDAIAMTPHQWQTTPYVLVLPGLAAVAAVLLAEIHGRSGFFPAFVRLRPEGGPPPKFVPAEVIGLSSVRELAREKR